MKCKVVSTRQQTMLYENGKQEEENPKKETKQDSTRFERKCQNVRLKRENE